MKAASPANTERIGLLLRLSLLCVLLVIQLEAVEVALRRYFDSGNMFDSVWAPLLDYKFYIYSSVVVLPAALLLMVWPRCRRHAEQLQMAAATHAWLPVLTLQLALYGGFVLLTFYLSTRPELFAGYSGPGLLAWAAVLLATVVCWLLVLAPAGFWRRLLEEEKQSVALAVLVTLLATGFTTWLRSFAPSLAVGALYGAHALISLFYDPVVFDIAERSIGTPGFSVQVSIACAGYEGIALVTVFLAVYLWLFRRDFRFPWALLAFPVGIVVIWLLNIARIAALIAIGDAWSPAVATAGFHSNAGWIAFLAVSLGLVSLLHRVPLFMAQAARGQASGNAKPLLTGLQSRTIDALLLPFAVLLGSGLLLGALSAGFDVWYPAKVIATGCALWYFKGLYQFTQYRVNIESLATGALVFVVWMLLVPRVPEQAAGYSEQFAQWPATVTFAWVAFRLLGSVVTVPLAEELAFRGYLLPRLGGNPAAINSRIPFSLFAFAVSSVLFGLLHGAWLAGTLAGLAYGWLRYRRGLLGDAVVAHMTTNLLLSAYVLVTGQWSYW